VKSNSPSAHNFDFKRWLTWGEKLVEPKDDIEEDCLPEEYEFGT